MTSNDLVYCNLLNETDCKNEESNGFCEYDDDASICKNKSICIVDTTPETYCNGNGAISKYGDAKLGDLTLTKISGTNTYNVSIDIHMIIQLKNGIILKK